MPNHETRGLGAVELGLAIIGVVTTLLLLAGFSERRVLLASLVALAFGSIYVAWRVGRGRMPPMFLDGGATRGVGYAADFSGATESLLLMHVDDDAPGADLHQIYRAKLDQGVQVRRLVLLRGDHHEEGYQWLGGIPEHQLLQQRVVQTGSGIVMPLSFVVVDEAVVLLAVPGFRPGESGALADRMILRHLVRLEGPEVVRAFVEAYEAMWRTAG